MPDNNSSPDARHAARLEKEGVRDEFRSQQKELVGYAAEALQAFAAKLLDCPDAVVHLSSAIGGPARKPDVAAIFQIEIYNRISPDVVKFKVRSSVPIDRGPDEICFEFAWERKIPNKSE